MELMTIRSGSNANCIYIKNGRYGILIDAGAGIRTIETALRDTGSDMSRIAAIFITHEHIDHIHGLCPITKKYHIPIFANDATAAAIRGRFPEMSESDFVSMSSGSDAVCPDLKVTSFRTSHDAAESVGYTVTDGLRRVSVATDLGVVTETVLLAIRRSNAVVLESNYDENMLREGSYPPPLQRRILSMHGHLSNDDCAVTASALVEGGTTKLILGHLSKNNNLPTVAYNTTQRALSDRGVDVGGDVMLGVASRDKCSVLIEV